MRLRESGSLCAQTWPSYQLTLQSSLTSLLPIYQKPARQGLSMAKVRPNSEHPMWENSTVIGSSCAQDSLLEGEGSQMSE